jgi:hypothetical protein
MAEAIEQLVSATVASLQASDVDHLDGVSRRGKPAHPTAAAVVRRRKEDTAS